VRPPCTPSNPDAPRGGRTPSLVRAAPMQFFFPMMARLASKFHFFFLFFRILKLQFFEFQSQTRLKQRPRSLVERTEILPAM